MMISSLPYSAMRCREIADFDVNNVAETLERAFPERSRDYWLQVFERLAKHSTPAGMPKYGYLIESEGTPVGALLLISSRVQENDTLTIRCNVSSWCAEPNFRIHAQMLNLQATRKKEVTYFNISPARHTIPIIEAQGFLRYSNGQFVASVFPSIRRRDWGEIVESHLYPNAPFETHERDLLLTHAKYGCMSVWCTTPERAYPFVFLPRIVKGLVPCVQLIYCRHIEDFVRFARPIGSYLALRGRPFVLIDANGPIRAMAGTYFDGFAPKYFKGPAAPRLGDLAYTEAAILPDLYRRFRRRAIISSGQS
jgi:hypothetical protein